MEACVDKPELVIIDSSTNEEEYEKWNKDNFMARGYIITSMTKIYAKQFTKELSAKKIWDKLAEKYKQEEDKNRPLNLIISSLSNPNL